MRVALDHDGRGDAAQGTLFLVLIDDDRRGVGQLVAREPKQLFAHDLGGHEALAAVGQLIGAVHPRLLGQVGLADDQQAIDVLGVLGRHRHELGKVVALLHVTQPGRQFAAPMHLIELVGQQQRRHALGQQGQHLGIGQVELTGFHHHDNEIDIADSAHHGLVERAVQRVGVAGLKAWRVDKHILSRAERAHARDTVARGLRLARGDADFLAHQGIEQRRFAHVGLAHNGDQAAALLGGGHRSRVRRGVGCGVAGWRRAGLEGLRQQSLELLRALAGLISGGLGRWGHGVLKST